MFPIFNRGHKIRGTVVLMSKNALDLNSVRSGVSVAGTVDLAMDIFGAVVDGATAILSRSVALQLISATKTDRNYSYIIFLLFISLPGSFFPIHYLCYSTHTFDFFNTF